MPALHQEQIRTTIAVENGTKRVSRDLAAVMLADGRWYAVEDPTLPDGPDGYLSFLQRPTEDGRVVMVNVPIEHIKGFAYFGTPAATT